MNTTKLTLSIFWQHAWRHPYYVLGLFLVRPISVLSFRILPPLIAAGVISRLGEGDYIPGDFWGSFSTEILQFAGLVLLGGVLTLRLEIYLLWTLESYVVRDLLRSMFNKYLKLDASFHADSFGGSLVSRASKLSGSYVRFADNLIFQIIPTVLSFLFIIVIMYPKSPVFVWTIVTIAAVFVTITALLSKKTQRLESIESAAHNANTGTLADAVTNVMAIKSFSAYKYEVKRFNKVTENTRHKTLDIIKAVLVREFFASVITSALQVIALIVAVIAIVEKSSDLAVVFLMFQYASFLSEALWEFQSSTIRNFTKSMGDAAEAVETLVKEPAVKDVSNPRPFKSIRGSIEFKNVTFDHNDMSDSALFEKLNLVIKPGEKVGLVGHSGGGKTTLTKLIMRLMDVDSGKILIDSQDISQVRQDDLRKYLSYVPQEPVMFHRSLAENIGYGRQRASQKEIEAVAKMAHAHDFIKNLPNGYKTLVGERGVKLSGGQRQRIAIARAMLKNAPILLLDEATSALDSDSERLIQDALWKLMKNKTAIIIAHRLSTIQKMDRILVLENGQIVEEGTHRELINNDGIYAELWAHQSGGFIEE